MQKFVIDKKVCPFPPKVILFFYTAANELLQELFPLRPLPYTHSGPSSCSQNQGASVHSKKDFHQHASDVVHNKFPFSSTVQPLNTSSALEIKEFKQHVANMEKRKKSALYIPTLNRNTMPLQLWVFICTRTLAPSRHESQKTDENPSPHAYQWPIETMQPSTANASVIFGI